MKNNKELTQEENKKVWEYFRQQKWEEIKEFFEPLKDFLLIFVGVIVFIILFYCLVYFMLYLKENHPNILLGFEILILAVSVGLILYHLIKETHAWLKENYVTAKKRVLKERKK